ncbi:MAG: CBS domain-containing protein [Kiritimatiellia bacterium]|jgi:CBS domain-containing protein
MHTLQQILKQKENDDIWSVPPTNTVFEAIQVMADKRAGALLVMDGDKLEGIISERDYAREVILKGRSSKKTLVGEIMSSNVITVAPTDSVQNALEVMTEHHIRHLPIIDNTTVVGVVSLGDLVKDVISVQKTTIEQLESYIRT